MRRSVHNSILSMMKPAGRLSVKASLIFLSWKKFYDLAVKDVIPFLFEGQNVLVTAIGAAK